MNEVSARHAMPLLHVGQANKELSHNEALIIADGLLQPCVEGILDAEPANLSSQDSGKCWIVGPSPSGNWVGEEDKIAYWVGASWRFLEMPEHGKVYSKDIGAEIIRGDNGWNLPGQIASPNGGSTVDTEARTAISAILSALEDRHIIPV